MKDQETYKFNPKNIYVKPNQFICDKCHGLIDNPRDGFLEYINCEDKVNRSFRIIHKNIECRSAMENWYNTYEDIVSYEELTFFTDSIGGLKMMELSSEKMDSFDECFKRIHLPYYENSRLLSDNELMSKFFLKNYSVEISSQLELRNILMQNL